MPDEYHRSAQRADRVTQVGDEAFGADREGVRYVTPAVPRRVVAVDGAKPGEPRKLTRPGGAAPHQSVHQNQRPARAASVGQQIAGHDRHGSLAPCQW